MMRRGFLLFAIIDNRIHGFSVRKKGRSILRIYTGDDGRSHIERRALEFEPFVDKEGAQGQATVPVGAKSISFRTGKPRYELSWHCAPRRQMIIMLGGTMEIEVGDGTAVRAAKGDCVLAEDLTGQGHITRVVGEEERFYAVIPLEENPEELS
jgi:quercetin dioxygenase-like cupin family protein